MQIEKQSRVLETVFLFGGDGRDRTGDLLRDRQTL